VTHIETWVNRLMRFAPLAAISQELVKFDMQALQNPEISGVEYQQGILQGYEVREYLLEKWQRQCAYCGKQDVPLEVEHIQPKSSGGSNRMSNLTLACRPCNEKKGNRSVQEFLSQKPDTLKRILAQAKTPLKDAAAVNASRFALREVLRQTGLEVETGSGGLTKFNRTRRGLPKAHWIDAVCVGHSTPAHLNTEGVKPLKIKATGHGSRQMCCADKFGFPRTAPKTVKRVDGFQTGDQVRLVQPSGKYAGIHIGTVSIRATQQFDISTTKNGKKIKITAPSSRFTHLHRGDGYAYA
jgi:5-methylcytosine-specific restriction endonuclease McrA